MAEMRNDNPRPMDCGHFPYCESVSVHEHHLRCDKRDADFLADQREDAEDMDPLTRRLAAAAVLRRREDETAGEFAYRVLADRSLTELQCEPKDGADGLCSDCGTDCGGSCWEADLRYCSLCDGIGHGYPGGGPCPLEERGSWEPEERW